MTRKKKTNPADALLWAAIHAKHGAAAFGMLASALASGANPNMTHDGAGFNQSALDRACRLDEPWASDLAVALLDAGASPFFGDKGITALHWACREGHPNTARALVDRGLDVNATSAQGWTPFLCAAAKGSMELCEELATRANVNQTAEDGSAELRIDAALLFIAQSNSADALAAYRLGWGSPATVANSRWTPLIRAIQHQNDELVEYLATHPKTDRAHLDFDEKTAMHFAAASGRPGYVKLLAEQGYPLDKFDSKGLSPLGKAILSEQWDCARQLLELGADPSDFLSKKRSTSDSEGSWAGLDALCIAAASERQEAFDLGKTFVDRCRGSTKSLRSKNTALHLAASNGAPELAEYWTRLLLAKGWSPSALNRQGQNPLMHAMAEENWGAMNALLPATNLKQKNKLDMDALGIAEWLASTHKNEKALVILRAHMQRKEMENEIPQAPPKRRRPAL